MDIYSCFNLTVCIVLRNVRKTKLKYEFPEDLVVKATRPALWQPLLTSVCPAVAVTEEASVLLPWLECKPCDGGFVRERHLPQSGTSVPKVCRDTADEWNCLLVILWEGWCGLALRAEPQYLILKLRLSVSRTQPAQRCKRALNKNIAYPWKHDHEAYQSRLVWGWNIFSVGVTRVAWPITHWKVRQDTWLR